MPIAFSQVAAVQPSDDKVKMSSPGSGEVLKSCLSARLEWEYALKEKALVRGKLVPYWNYLSVNLKVSANEDMSDPLVDVHLPDHITSWRLAVLPEHKYYWQIIPRDKDGDQQVSGPRFRWASRSVGGLLVLLEDTTGSMVLGPRCS